MRFTELADYAFPGGHVVEWSPHTEPGRMSCSLDQRRISHNHERHLRGILDAPPPDDQSWIGCAFRIVGPFDPEAWRNTLSTWIRRHEVLRSHATVEDGTPTRYTLESAAVRVRARTIGNLDETAARRQADRVLSAKTSPLHWPSYLFITIAGVGGFTVVFGADHAITDGYTVALVASELAVLYDEARTGASDTVLPAVGSYLEFSEAERAHSDQIPGDHPAIEPWRRFVAEPEPDRFGTTLAPAHACVFPLARGYGGGLRTPQRTLSLPLLDADEATAVTAIARSHHTGLLAALLAGLGSVTTALSGREDFRTVVPRCTRADAAMNANTAGWFVDLSPVTIHTATAASFGELIAAAGSELRWARSEIRVPFGRACELLGIEPHIAFFASFMDLRAVHRLHRPAEFSFLRGTNHSPDDHYFWFFRTDQGLSVSARYPDTAESAEDVHTTVLRLRALLAELAHHGDIDLAQCPTQRAGLV